MTRELLNQSMSFDLNPSSGLPAYIQLMQQVEEALRMGHLEVGDQLPTIKQVVAEVAINPNTVLKAYRELENAGLIAGRQGLGTFVVKRPTGPSPSAYARLSRSLVKWIDGARREGFDDDAIEAILRSTLKSVNEGAA